MFCGGKVVAMKARWACEHEEVLAAERARQAHAEKLHQECDAFGRCLCLLLAPVLTVG